MLKSKTANLPTSITYSMSLVPNRPTVVSILGKNVLTKEEYRDLKGKPVQLTGTLFTKIYNAIQKNTKEATLTNKEVIISIVVPSYTPYKLIVDTKKIRKNAFLTLLQESIGQEEDVQKAEKLYQEVVLDLRQDTKRDSIEQTHLKKISKPINNIDQIGEGSAETKTSEKTIVFDEPEEVEVAEQPIETSKELIKEKSMNDSVGQEVGIRTYPKIKVSVDFLKTVDVGKSKVLVTDPEYEKEKYNQEARKVNQLINRNVSSIENNINKQLQEKNDLITKLETAEMIRLQNEEITKNNPSELIQIYQEKEKELDKKKRERIFSLNEELEEELQELRQNYEKQIKVTNEAYFKKKNNEMATCTYQFETWISNEFQSKWNEHYHQLRCVLDGIEEKNKEEIRTETNTNIQTVQEYTKRVKKDYAEAVKTYLDERKPLLKQEILSDITIYQKQVETKKLSEALTKEEVAKLLHEQEIRLQESLEEKKKTLEKPQEPIKRESSMSIDVLKNRIHRLLTKRVKIVLVGCLTVSFLGGLGFSVYKKVTYVAPFDTMISSEDYDSAIKNYPNQKYEVVNLLYEKILNGDSHALADLKEVNDTNETVLGSFDLAVFNQEYKNALSIYSKEGGNVPKKYWEKRYAVIGYCYLKDGQVKEAESFQEKSGDQVLLDKISDYKQLTSQISTLSEDLDKAKKQSHLIEDKKEKATYDSKIAEQEKAIGELKSELRKI